MKKVLPILILLVIFGLSNSIAQTFFVNADFETGALPVGWTSTTATTGGQWVFGNSFNNAYLPLDPHTKYALINDNGCACVEDSARLTTPVMNMSAAATVYMTFDHVYGAYHLTGGTQAREIFYVEYSINGGTSWSLLDSVPYTQLWETYGRDISTLVHNQAAVKVRFYYSDHGSSIVGAAVDNVKIFAPATNSVAMADIAPVAGTTASYAVVPGSITISGNLYNYGSGTIASATIKYSDGGAPVSYAWTGSIAPFATGGFTLTTPYAPTVGPHNIKVWVDLTGDTNHADDTLSTILTGAAFAPVHKVTFEEATGTWCGWCPRGAVFMDSMAVVHPTTTELVAVHNNDPMTVTAYDAGVGGYISGYPSLLVERKVSDDPSAIFTEYAAHINDFGVATIGVNTSFNWATRALTVTATATFAIPVTGGGWNLAMVTTEENVHGTSTAWDQHNYYSFQSQNLALNGAGHNWQTSPNPVLAANMWFDHVGRSISGTFNGTAGSLPATIAVSAPQTYVFNYTIPAGQAPEHMKAIVMLINTTTGQIVNANSKAVSPTGINEVNASLNAVNIYPNPTSAQTTINFDLAKASNVSVTITNMLGQVVDSFENGMMPVGNHNILFNAQDLSSGLYLVTLKTGENTFSQKISIQK